MQFDVSIRNKMWSAIQIDRRISLFLLRRDFPVSGIWFMVKNLSLLEISFISGQYEWVCFYAFEFEEIKDSFGIAFVLFKRF